jgi:hypothetical protein
MSDLIPFLGHVGMEKMTCARDPSTETEVFIRFIANTAPRPIPDCQSGPGASCPFTEFRDIIGEGALSHKNFHKVCDKKGKQDVE